MSFFIASTWNLNPPIEVGKSVLQIDEKDRIKEHIDDRRAERKINLQEDSRNIPPYNVFQTKIPSHTSTEVQKILELK